MGPDFGDEKAGKRIDEALELKKLSKSILLNFLELVGVVGINPSAATEKLEDVRTLFINMHHNINKWRPHQTREALIALMQAQLEKTQNETKSAREATENARRVLEGLASIEIPDNLDLQLEDTRSALEGWSKERLEAAERSRDRETWAAMDALFE